MTTTATILTDAADAFGRRNTSTPAPREQWFRLWTATGAAHAPPWAGEGGTAAQRFVPLVGPPGAAAGDTYPTHPADYFAHAGPRPVDRSHPVWPAVADRADVDGDVEVVVLATHAAAERGGGAQWFTPGTLYVTQARAGAEAVGSGGRSVTLAATDAARGGAGAYRPAALLRDVEVGAVVAWRDAGVWRVGRIVNMATI